MNYVSFYQVLQKVDSSFEESCGGIFNPKTALSKHGPCSAAGTAIFGLKVELAVDMTA